MFLSTKDLFLPTILIFFFLSLISCNVTPETQTETLVVAVVEESDQDSTNSDLKEMAIERVFPEIDMSKIIFLADPGDNTDRLFAVLQSGEIVQFNRVLDDTKTEVFIDLSERVSTKGNEEGLLGLAFDPSYSNNGFFYVYYSASSPRRSVVSRFKVDNPQTGKGEITSEKILLEIGQPFSNHNGGHISFGPDGYLYIALGDGGKANDPYSNGQNLSTLLGSILRIDVRDIDSETGYTVPSDNPFVNIDGNVRKEIWAYGLRNPWRFSFDRDTGDLWAGDVGQNRFEEIDLVKAGNNYGWKLMEGLSCFPRGNQCDSSGIQPPVIQYGRDDGCSVTGGYVYRGKRLPSLFGAYVYGDFCTGNIWALRYDGEAVTEHLKLVDSNLSISSFAEDRAGEIYIVSYKKGIYQLVNK